MARFLYQGRVEPVGPLQPPPAAPPFGWFAQSGEPVRKVAQQQSALFSAPPPAITITLGWYVQPSESDRRRQQIFEATSFVGASIGRRCCSVIRVVRPAERTIASGKAAVR